MNLSQRIKEAEERFEKEFRTDIVTDHEYYSGDKKRFKQFLSQELRNLAEDMAKEIVPEEIKQVDGNWDKKPLKEGEEAIYCLTCGAFYYEGACICRAKNNIINEIKQRLETYLK